MPVVTMQVTTSRYLATEILQWCDIEDQGKVTEHATCQLYMFMLLRPSSMPLCVASVCPPLPPAGEFRVPPGVAPQHSTRGAPCGALSLVHYPPCTQCPASNLSCTQPALPGLSELPSQACLNWLMGSAGRNFRRCVALRAHARDRAGGNIL